MNDFLTVSEMAEELNVTTRTIRNYLADGKLEGKKIGGQWRFLKSELYKFIGESESSDIESIIKNQSDSFESFLVINIPIKDLEKIDKLKKIIVHQYNNVYEGDERKFFYQLKSSESAQIIIQGNYYYILNFGKWIFQKIEEYKNNY